MSESTNLGVAWSAPARAPLCEISTEIVPVDLLAQWRRCGMLSDGLAEYLSYAFARREVARSILSTVVNELVENVAKYAADKLAPARISVAHLGEKLLVATTSVASAEHVERLGAELAELAAEDAAAVFARRMAQRLGLGLALVANDYGAAINATVTPSGGGLSTVCVRAVLPSVEVEQR